MKESILNIANSTELPPSEELIAVGITFVFLHRYMGISNNLSGAEDHIQSETDIIFIHGFMARDITASAANINKFSM